MIVQAYIVDSINDVRQFKRNRLLSFDYELIIRSTGVRYQWSPYSQVDDNDYSVLAPLEPGVGRWVIQPASALGPPGEAGPAGPPGADGAGSDPFDLEFFDHNGLLPDNEFLKEALDFPAPDFENRHGGTLTRSMSLMKLAGAANPANVGWNLLAAKSTILALIGNIRPNGQYNVGFGLSPSLPIASELPDNSYLWLHEPYSGHVRIYKQTPTLSYTIIGDSDITGLPNAITAQGTGLGMYYDDATNRLILFVREAGRWWPALDITDATFTTFQYLSIVFSAVSGQKQAVVAPFGIWTN